MIRYTTLRCTGLCRIALHLHYIPLQCITYYIELVNLGVRMCTAIWGLQVELGDKEGLALKSSWCLWGQALQCQAVKFRGPLQNQRSETLWDAELFGKGRGHPGVHTSKEPRILEIRKLEQRT